MPVVKAAANPAAAAAAPAPSKAPVRTTRARRAATTTSTAADTDALASELDRVLKVAQPKSTTTTAVKTKAVVPSKRVPAKPASTTPTASTTTPTATTAKPPTRSRSVSTAKKPTPAPAPVPASAPASAPSTLRSRRPTVSRAPLPSSAKGKSKPQPAAPAPAPKHPWVSPDMPARDRAAGAQAAMKNAARALAEAQRAGFKYTPAAAKSEAFAGVEEALGGALAGLGVVRELFCGERFSAAQGLGIERGGFNLALQCMLLDMHKQALGMLVESKAWILKLYQHDNEEPKASLSLAPSPVPSASKKTVTVNLARLGVFPRPTGTVDEATRTLICNFALAVWCCLIALGKVEPSSVQAYLPFPSPDADPLSPVTLAPTLPPGNNASLGVLICRRVSTLDVAPGSAEWLHVRRVTAFLLAICVSRSQAKPNLPDKVWDSVGRTAQVYLQERNDDAARREIAAFIDRIVGIVEVLATSRGEKRDEWFTGSWPEVADMWIGIGRTLGDSGIIDQALSAMTSGVTIASSRVSSATASGSSTPTRTPKASSAAAADLARFSARLAKTLMEVDAFSKTEAPTSDGLEQLLANAAPGDAVDLICDLEDSEASLSAATSAIRAIERLRRVVVKLLDRPTLPAAREWLEDAFTASESVISRLDKPALISAVARDCLPGVVDTTSNVLRVWDLSDAASATRFIDRAYATLQACGENVDVPSRIQYGAFLVQTAHGTAYRLTRVSAPQALALAQRACDWTLALRASVPADPEVLAKLKNWDVTEAALARRFELVGFCSSDSTKALEAYVLGLVNLAQPAVKAIERGAGCQSLTAAFSGSADAATLLKRISALLTADEAIEGDVLSIVQAAVESRQQSKAFRGAILEQMIDSIEHAQFRPHVQGAMVALSDYLLGIYDASYPVRRMRVAVRLMNLVVSTGVIPDRFPALVDDVAALVPQDPAHDAQLLPFKFEYQASALILSALNKYHTEPEPSAAVAALGSEAVAVIRAVVLPPIKEAHFPAATGKRTVQRRAAVTVTAPPAARPAPRTTKAKPAAAAVPARRTASTKSDTKAEPVHVFVTDDINRFSQLLGSLASLFGLLGHVLPRLETLKVLRAVLRSSERMGDALVHTSGLLAAEYGRLGKYSRAAQVFAQALKADASPGTRADLRLRHARFLAATGSVQHARDEYAEAEALMRDMPASNGRNYAARYVELCAAAERIALAHGAMAAIKMAEADVTAAIESLNVAYRLWSRAASGISRIAANAPEEQETGEVGVAVEPASTASPESTAPPPSTTSPAASTSKTPKQSFCLSGKHLGGLQWYYALGVFDSTLDLVAALAQRGTVKECEYYLAQAKGMAPAIRSTALDARVSGQTAALDARKTKFESSADNLRRAAEVLAVHDGPDAIELKRLRGELYSRQQAAPEAEEFFANAIEALVSLDDEFKTAEAHSSSPKKEAKTPIKEPLLPHALGGILRQRAWILREAGIMDEYEAAMQQLEQVPKAAGEKPEQLFLDARVAMSEAFNHFKTDLFMSSLTESTIAMTMASPDKRIKDRQSTRHGANILLERAVEAFRVTLATDARTGRVEDIRQACVSLAVLGAYQTSLGQGSPEITAMAAGILASISSLTLHRELVPAINSKFTKAADDLDWPRLERDIVEVEIDATPTSAYWKSIAEKHNAADLLDAQYDLASLPRTWAVVSITVTDDRNTMLVSRHQNGFDPMVFCIPLDRQGRREGEEESELFTFDAGINEMRAIMDGNDESIKSIGACKTMDDRKAWWKERHALDGRLGELLATIEFCWLGAFKTVLNPRPIIDHAAFTTFRDRLDVIFQTALSSAGTDTRRGARVRLNDTLLTCFATLSSKCKDEEVEDLVYFVLDQYQFHGIAVALAELDFDQLGVDVKTALADLEAATALHALPPSNEHLLLALDKNVQGIPWESLPILRGRAVSRIPSLPFLLDQVALGAHLGHSAGTRTIDASKTTFFMNPGGDLTGTEARFASRLDALQAHGWTGIRGRAPTEPEMATALAESDLVMYFGHGGAEEYIRGHKVRALPRCAVTMLWGCSSGRLRAQGGFDRTGTPLDYVLAGSACLVANLWDVTDKDIDRVTALVMDHLGLDGEGKQEQNKLSVVQAVSAARSCAKLEFLTGAATVVYGVPVYIQ